MSEKDILKAGVLNYPRCINVVEEVFGLLDKGDYIMGGPNGNSHGHSIFFPVKSKFQGMPIAGPDRRFVAMIAYLGGRFNVCGEKWYGSNINNHSKGLPRSVLMIILNDPDTVEPLCLMSGNLISSVRTGAVVGVGVRYLAHRHAKICTIIGAGTINKACFEAIKNETENLQEVVISDLNNEKANLFSQWINLNYDIKARTSSSLEEAIRTGDIISVAASRLKPVQLYNDWLKRGSLMIMTGPAKVDEAFWLNTKLFLDNPKMHKAYMKEADEQDNIQEFYNTLMAGQIYTLVDEGKLPTMEKMPDFANVVLNKEAGRLNDEERITLINSGMAVMDVGWSYEIYSRAKSMRLGKMLTLWDEPYQL